MDGFSVNSDNHQIIITIDRSLMDINFVNNLIERLRIEQLVKKADFKEDIMDVAEEIKKDWWKKNKAEYLKGVMENAR